MLKFKHFEWVKMVTWLFSANGST